MINLILDILRDSYEHGARKFLVLHAHMANLPIAFEAIDLFLREAKDAKVMAASWWDFASEETRNQIAMETSVDRTVDHHAAMVETSLMLYMAPERVKKDLLADDGSVRQARYLVLPTPDDLITKTGVVYNASLASREIGERLTSEIINGLVDAVKLELG
jgi:creatinine amidohydrolase